MPHTLEDAQALVVDIEGWLSDREARFLYREAQRASADGVILEIGSFKGKSTVCLAMGSSEGNKCQVYALDPHVGGIEQDMWMKGRSSFEDFKTNIAKARVEDVVTPIIRKSQEAATGWDKALSLLWIDGDHSYEAAKADFQLFSKWLIDGGVVAFHDSTQGELPRLIVECLGSEGFVKLGLIDSITYATKSIGRAKTMRDRFILRCVANYHRARWIPGLKGVKGLIKRALARL